MFLFYLKSYYQLNLILTIYIHIFHCDTRHLILQILIFVNNHYFNFHQFKSLYFMILTFIKFNYNLVFIVTFGDAY